MRLLKSILVMAAAAMTVAGCAHDVETAPAQRPSVDGKVEVGFMLPVDTSRTTIDSDGRTTRWVAGDKVLLWAENSAGNYTIEAEPFSLVRFSQQFDKAFFTAMISPMEADSYRYIMCSPLPDAVEGTKVMYNVSSVQSGAYDGIHDIMVATPTEAGALTKLGTEFDVQMHHQLHAVRIDIPEGRNLFGRRFTTLEITFPAPVVGDITFDVSNPTAAPQYTNLSNVITVSNAEGFDAGDTIWVFVLPGMVDGSVSYRVNTEDQRSEVASYPFSRNMLGGHVTPIRMATPPMERYTSFHFSVGANYLGEDFNSLTIKDHNGTALGTFQRNAQNEYILEYYGEIDLTAYQNKIFTIEFDSPHAIVSNTLAMGQLTPYTKHVMQPVDVPYLFEESFSDVSAFSDGHDDPANGFNGDSNNYSSWFSNYTSHSRMAGWSGGRYGCSSGSIRMCCRTETALAIKSYRGRIDTAPMSKIKSGVTTSLRVQFDYSAANRTYLLASGSTLLNFGWTNTSGVIGPATDITNKVINGKEISDTSGSYTNVRTHADVTFSGASNATRLSWMSSTNASGSIGNANFWLYVDNIKVQIAP